MQVSANLNKNGNARRAILIPVKLVHGNLCFTTAVFLNFAFLGHLCIPVTQHCRHCRRQLHRIFAYEIFRYEIAV